MIINPEIPLEIFLPPSDFKDVHVLATKDSNGLNTGIFFIRVHRWSVEMLMEVLGFKFYKPEVDLGHSADQKAMEIIFEEPERVPFILYQPRLWYNAYDIGARFEARPGDIIVHFPGFEEFKADKMRKWWETLKNETTSAQWTVPLSRTGYISAVERYWQTARDGRRMIKTLEDYIQKNDNACNTSELSDELNKLKYVVSKEPDQENLVQSAMERIKVVVPDIGSQTNTTI
jgi:hypothetical protein